MDPKDFKEEDVIDIGTKFNFLKYRKKMKNIAWLGLLLVIVISSLLASFYKIEDGHSGVVLRLGEVVSVENQAGIHIKIPFIDQVKEINVSQVRVMEYGYITEQVGSETELPVYSDLDSEATVIIDAANNNASIALINLMIEYRVENPVDYLFEVDDVEGTLQLVLEDAVRNTVQELTLDEAKTQKEIIDQNVFPKLQGKMDEYGTGIQIVSVKTQNVEFLPNVETAYREKENANQYKNSKLEEAQKYSNAVLPSARAEATKMLEEARAYQREVLANAKADVAQFNALYEEYSQNPEIIKEKYYIEAMQAFITNNNIVIDGTLDDSIYKFFNLDQESMVKENVVE